MKLDQYTDTVMGNIFEITVHNLEDWVQNPVPF